MELRLVTIPISHYCEKARWALERAGLSYSEERHVQGIHRFYAKRAGGGFTVPVLVTPEGSIGESEEILAWVDQRTPADQRLFPDDSAERAEVEELSRRLDERLGPRGRRLMYVQCLPDRDTMLEYNNQGVPRWEDRALRAGWPIGKRFVEQALGVRPGVEVRDEEVVWEEFDRIAELLADGRTHLCGERFTAADLTFAALAAAIVVPPVYGVPLPQPEILPSEMRRISERARAHPAGVYALKLFAERRR